MEESTPRPLLYSVPQAMAALNASEYQVRRMLATGVLPTIWVGTMIRIPVEAVEEYASTPSPRLPSGRVGVARPAEAGAAR